MSVAIRFRNRRGELAEVAQVSASAAKNGFGRILDRVGREGALAITKHDQPFAVLISVDEYRALVDAEGAALNTLSAEFDALFARMQKPGAAAAMQKAFALTRRELGRAAVRSAAVKGVALPVTKRGAGTIKDATLKSAWRGRAAVKGARRARG